jgi:diaminopimelate epimerase
MKCGNATHCFVQLIDANKNAKIELHNLFSNAKESNLTI